jgi:multiple sugar transport system ATP-binding protein
MIYVTHDQVEAMTLGDRIVVMNAGVVQQQGTAEELFADPVNRFVAGFIGSPSMNFLDGELRGDRVVGDGFDLPLSPELAAGAARAGNARVVVGLRPSAIGLAGEAPLQMRVVVSEYLGAQSVLVCRCGPAEVLAEIASGDRIPAGQTRTFSVATGEIMLFDHDSGARLRA